MATSGNSRFIYNANAVAVGANFGSGNSLTKSWAACSLPHVGGVAEADGGSFNNGVLKFDSAKTELTGKEIGGKKYETTALTTVTGLNILGKITADEVTVKLVFRFKDDPTPKLKKLEKVELHPKPNPATGSLLYRNLKIDNVNDYSTVELDDALADKAGQDHAQFRKDLPGSGKLYYETKNGKVFMSLAKTHDGLTDKPEEHAFSFVDVAGLGRVYFAEWVEAEEWQSITALRIVLTGNPTGEIVIADPIGNGQFYP